MRLLNDLEKAICRELGCSESEFIAARNARAANAPQERLGRIATPLETRQSIGEAIDRFAGPAVSRAERIAAAARQPRDFADAADGQAAENQRAAEAEAAAQLTPEELAMARQLRVSASEFLKSKRRHRDGVTTVDMDIARDAAGRARSQV